MTTPTCPITSRPLPDGYHLHPTTREDFEHAFTRISIVFAALKEYQLGLTAPWETEIRTQPTSRITLREVETIDRLTNRVQNAIRSIAAPYQTRAGEAVIMDNLYMSHYPGHFPYLAVGIRVAYNHLDEVLRREDAPQLYHDIVDATKEAEHILDNRNAPTLPAVCCVCAELTPTSRKWEETKCSGCGAMFDTELGIQAAQQRALGVVGMAKLARKMRL